MRHERTIPIASATERIRGIRPPPQQTRSSRAYGGFALPLVVLLLLVGGLTIGLLMERHGVSYRAIVRHVENYKSHHRAAGIKECILRWLDTARARVDQSLDENGLAFSMEVSGEGRIDVYLRDAQGACLSDPAALSGRRREIVEDMKFLLESIPAEGRPQGCFRPVGPSEMSIDSTPDIVIRALCRAVIAEPEKADRAATAIFDRRATTRSLGGPGALGGQSGGGAGNIADALRDVDILERQRREIAAMLVATPTLYECVVETRDTGNRLLNKSAGLYQIDETRSDTFKQGGFLTWDALPVEEERGSR